MFPVLIVFMFVCLIWSTCGSLETRKRPFLGMGKKDIKGGHRTHDLKKREIRVRGV